MFIPASAAAYQCIAENVYLRSDLSRNYIDCYDHALMHVQWTGVQLQYQYSSRPRNVSVDINLC